MTNFLKVTIVVVVAVVSACGGKPEITDAMLDGEVIFDPSISHPEKYLISVANPHPTVEEREKPVFIAAHGYTATTFEWDEFRDWLDKNQEDVYLSQVLLGGHGTDYENFREATWDHWQQAIIDEYNQLQNAGYTNLNLVGASAGGALMIDMVAKGYFVNNPAPNNIFLVDPFVIPENKMLSFVGVLGPFIGYTEEEQSAEEDKVWYHFRPYETLQELHNLSKTVQSELKKGITLPATTYMKVYKTTQDPTVDATSADLIREGMTTADGKPVDVEMIDSDLHVFTRLSLRDSYSDQDYAHQVDAFQEMVDRVTN